MAGWLAGCARWPGDMQQDELNGWRLRVYPARQPAALLGGDWEEYRDDSDPGRPMYYNRYGWQG